jgi:hypothetical protein
MKTTILQESINWDVSTEPILVNNSYSPNKKAIIRTDNGEILGIVGNEYSPVYNSILLQIANLISETGEFELEGFMEFNNGRIIHCYLKNKNAYLNMNGHMVYERMIIVNSHDGTTRFSVALGTKMARCGNSYSDTLKIFSRKHLSPIGINVLNIEQLLKTYKAKKDIIYSSFDGMDKIRVDESIVSKLISEVHKMLANDSRQIKPEDWKKSPSMNSLKTSIDREMRELGNNVFGLFNGVTWYTSHEMRNSESELGRLSGTAHLINQKAYRFCNNLKRINNQVI